jgi:ligand-binding sensor domain-containing protein
MKRNILIASLIFLVFFSCKKDDVNPNLKIYKNLDNLSISSLAFDKTQNLWIATDSGLFKSVSTGYELIEAGIDAGLNALTFEPKSNTLWIGTTVGIYQLVLGNSDSTAIHIPLERLSHQNVLSAYIDQDSVRWFGTETGVTRNSKDSWQKNKFKMNLTGSISDFDFAQLPINSINSWDGDYYFATAGNKLWRATNWDSKVDAFTGASMWDYPYNGMSITDTMNVVFIDSKGQQWFGGMEGIQVHIGHDPKTDNSSYYDELVSPIIHCIAEDNSGKIWVGTQNGISIFDGTTWSASSVSLPNKSVTAIAFDTNKKVWIGTKKGLVEISY